MNRMLKPRRGSLWTAVAWAVCLVIQGVASPVSAQFQFNQPQFPEYSPGERLRMRVPLEAQAEVTLAQAAENLQSQDYEAAINSLQGLLESSDDYFRFEQGALAGSALGRVETLLFSLPPEARELYVRRFGSLATQAFETARASGDLAGCLEIARQYPLTEAAKSALRLAADTAADQGEPALAARLWSRLLPHFEEGPERTALLLEIARAWTQAGHPAASALAIAELHKTAQQTPLLFEGKLLVPPDQPDRVWLEKVFGPPHPRAARRTGDWLMPGGHAGRWSDGPFAHPLHTGHWTYPLIDRYDFYSDGRLAALETHLSEMETRYLTNKALGVTPVQIGSPVAVGDQVFVAGYGSVKSIDAKTGELRWSGVAIDETFRYLTEQDYRPEDPGHQQFLNLMLGQRAWVNRTASTLASDGERVYAVNDTGIVGALTRFGFGMRPNQVPSRHELIPPSENRLMAYDAQSGLLQWVAGGPMAIVDPEGAAGTATEVILPGAFFLGAPLVLDGQVYVIAEDHGQVRVFSLDPQTGSPLWSLPLINPQMGVAYDEVRRFYGLTPCYAEGLLICPTGEGILVAVDPVMQRVAWINQYSQKTPQITDPRFRGFAGRGRNTPQPEFRLDTQIKERQWLDTYPVQAGSRLLYPASDAGMLYGLDPLTGEKQWEIERGDGLFIAGCTEKHVVIVGERSVRAIRLDDPRRVVWSLETPCPAGRGVLCGANYLLPVNTNEILVIHLETGRLLARPPLDARLGGGSLIAAGDRLFLQTTRQLVGFRTMQEIEQEIATTLDQGERRGLALVQKGELLLCRGKTDDGIAAIREALAIQDFPDARRMLVWTLLDQLKDDFAASRDLVPELKRLATESDQKQLLGRLTAEGIEQSGDALGAFREYLDLALTLKVDEQIATESQLTVRQDRWLRGRLSHLYLSASGDDQEQMRKIMDDVVAAQLNPVDQKKLATILGIDLAPQLHLALAMKNQFDNWMTARVLWTLTESPDLSLRARATARLVEIEVPLKRGRNVVHLARALQGELAEVEIEPGVTARSFLEKLPEATRSEIARLTAPIEGRPTLEEKPGAGTPVPKEIFPVLGAKRGPFVDWLFGFESPVSSAVAAYDASGKGRANANFGPMGEPGNRLIRYVQTDANLVLVGLRDQFTVLSPLDDASQTRFTGQLTSVENPLIGRRGIMIAPPALAPRPAVRHPYWQSTNGPLGNVGPLGFDTLVYLQGSLLKAVNPLSTQANPQIHWQRIGVTPGSAICADENYVIVIPPGDGKWLVLRAADGVLLAERDVPEGLVDRRYADWGRYFLVSRRDESIDTQPARRLLAMYDPVADSEVWSVSLSPGTEWAPVNGSDLALLAADGALSLVDWRTGNSRWTSQLPHIEKSPDRFSVHTDGQRIYLHTDSTPAGSPEVIREIPSLNQVQVNGIAAAINLTDGQVLWAKPMEQQLFRPHLPASSQTLVYCATRQKGNEPSSSTTLEILDAATGERLLSKVIVPLGGEGWISITRGLLLRIYGHDIRISRPGSVEDEQPPEGQREPEVPLKVQ